MNTRQQTKAFLALMVFYALLVFCTYAFFPLEQLSPVPGTPAPQLPLPAWQVGLIAAVGILVLYSLLGLAGLWLGRRAGLPGLLREGAGRREWLWQPLVIGAVVGLALIIGDRLFVAAAHDPRWTGFVHPRFPLSLIASATAGIGEEVLFRGFVMGLWAFLASLILRRWGAHRIAWWIGNIISALAFSAGHLPSALYLFNAASAAALPPLVLGEIVLLNSLLGLVAGERYMRHGLIAAMGIHFWADVLWHVLWPLLG